MLSARRGSATLPGRDHRDILSPVPATWVGVGGCSSIQGIPSCLQMHYAAEPSQQNNLQKEGGGFMEEHACQVGKKIHAASLAAWALAFTCSPFSAWWMVRFRLLCMLKMMTFPVWLNLGAPAT